MVNQAQLSNATKLALNENVFLLLSSHVRTLINVNNLWLSNKFSSCLIKQMIHLMGESISHQYSVWVERGSCRMKKKCYTCDTQKPNFLITEGQVNSSVFFLRDERIIGELIQKSPLDWIGWSLAEQILCFTCMGDAAPLLFIFLYLFIYLFVCLVVIWLI